MCGFGFAQSNGFRHSLPVHAGHAEIRPNWKCGNNGQKKAWPEMTQNNEFFRLFARTDRSLGDVGAVGRVVLARYLRLCYSHLLLASYKQTSHCFRCQLASCTLTARTKHNDFGDVCI